jgi:hypothetical protein
MTLIFDTSLRDDRMAFLGFPAYTYEGETFLDVWKPGTSLGGQNRGRYSAACHYLTQYVPSYGPD